MAGHGFVQPQDVDAAIAAPLALKITEGTTAPGAQEFVDAAREYLQAKYTEEQLDRLGATVTTTVDLNVQARPRPGCTAAWSRSTCARATATRSSRRRRRSRRGAREGQGAAGRSVGCSRR
jgi:membrane carboxypeptidase/penicillin-binding protein